MLPDRSTSSALVCLLPSICGIFLIFPPKFRILIFSLYPIFSDSGLSGFLLVDQICTTINPIIPSIVAMATTAPHCSCRNLIILIASLSVVSPQGRRGEVHLSCDFYHFTCCAGSGDRCGFGSTYSFLDIVCKVINIVLVECIEPGFNEIKQLVKAGLKAC